MSLTARVLGTTIAASVSVGLLSLAIVGFSTGRGSLFEGFSYTFASPRGLTEVLSIFALVVLPASFPATLVGGYIAVAAAKRQPTYPLLSWVTRGVVVGSLLGAAGSLLWFTAINLGDVTAEMVRFLSVVGLVGGAAGALVGGTVGSYCWRLTGGAQNGRSAAPLGVR